MNEKKCQNTYWETAERQNDLDKMRAEAELERRYFRQFGNVPSFKVIDFAGKVMCFDYHGHSMEIQAEERGPFNIYYVKVEGKKGSKVACKWERGDGIEISPNAALEMACKEAIK